MVYLVISTWVYQTEDLDINRVTDQGPRIMRFSNGQFEELRVRWEGELNSSGKWVRTWEPVSKRTP